MPSNRRTFIKGISAASALAATESIAKPFGFPAYIPNLAKISPNDKIRIATIGMGIQGNFDTQAALRNPDIELVACADLYTGRLEHAKQCVWQGQNPVHHPRPPRNSGPA